MISASPRRLMVFKCVVECGGFNLAAMELGIAQPSIGAHIQAIEKQLGQPLFHRRRGSRPILTKAGEALYSFATDMLKRSAEATSTLAELRVRDSSEVSLGLHRDIAPQFLTTYLAPFAAKFPKIHLVTRTGTIEDIVGLVRERVVNLGCALGLGPIPGLASDVLAKIPLLLVVAPNHPLARRKMVSSAEVKQHPFITGLRHSRYMNIVNRALHSIGIDKFEVAMELQESVSIKEMVRIHGGIAVLTAYAAEPEIKDRTLVSLRLERQPHEIEIRCAYLPPLSQSSQSCLNFLRART